MTGISIFGITTTILVISFVIMTTIADDTDILQQRPQATEIEIVPVEPGPEKYGGFYGPPPPIPFGPFGGGELKSFKLLQLPQFGRGWGWSPQLQKIPFQFPVPVGPGFGWPSPFHRPQIIPFPGWGWSPGGFPFRR